jgi:hypothetical protein
MFGLPVVALLACGTQDAPEVSVTSMDKTICKGTQPGNACITVYFDATDKVRSEAKSLKGPMHWALYNAGDVGGLGPGNATAVYEGEIDNADLGPTNFQYCVNIPNAKAQQYQSLGFLDIDMSGDDSGGDPVTLPSDPFNVPANDWTHTPILYDYVE